MSGHPDIVHLEPGHFYCAIPAALVNGDPVLCAGIEFRKVDGDRCELVFLSEQDVDRLTGPDTPPGTSDLVGPGSRFTGHKPHGDDRG